MLFGVQDMSFVIVGACFFYTFQLISYLKPKASLATVDRSDDLLAAVKRSQEQGHRRML